MPNEIEKKEEIKTEEKEPSFVKGFKGGIGYNPELKEKLKDYNLKQADKYYYKEMEKPIANRFKDEEKDRNWKDRLKSAGDIHKATSSNIWQETGHPLKTNDRFQWDNNRDKYQGIPDEQLDLNKEEDLTEYKRRHKDLDDKLQKTMGINENYKVLMNLHQDENGNEVDNDELSKRGEKMDNQVFSKYLHKDGVINFVDDEGNKHSINTNRDQELNKFYYPYGNEETRRLIQFPDGSLGFEFDMHTEPLTKRYIKFVK